MERIRGGGIGEGKLEGIILCLNQKKHFDFTLPPKVALVELKEARTFTMNFSPYRYFNISV